MVLAILTFTPVVTPHGKATPEVMGMPYTMWVGLLWTILLVVITWIGTQVHPGFEDKEQQP